MMMKSSFPSPRTKAIGRNPNMMMMQQPSPTRDFQQDLYYQDEPSFDTESYLMADPMLSMRQRQGSHVSFQERPSMQQFESPFREREFSHVRSLI